MSQEQSLMLLCIAILGIHWWEVQSKRDKIYCTLRRSNKTKVHKWAKIEDDHIVIAGLQFNIVERFVVYEWFKGGLLGWLFPTRVPALDYDESSEDPFNPDDMTDAHVISPRVRRQINNRGRMGAFAAGVAAQSGKKKSGIVEFLPWLAIIAVAGVAFMLYQDHQSNVALFNQVQQIQATLKSIVK